MVSSLIDLLHVIIDGIVAVVSLWGYIGIFVMMFLESSFFPFPSEIVMIPAGYLAQQGQMNIFIIIVIGTAGSIAGAWLNYLLAVHFGRGLLPRLPIIKYFVTQEKLERVEEYFKNHGPISTFSGRLIPVIRQYISFPAGLARMNGALFTFYTGLGAGIWVIILTVLGYYLGDNEELTGKYLHQILIGIIAFLIVLGAVYIYRHRQKNK